MFLESAFLMGRESIALAIQTLGDRINLHPHLHLLLTEGGVDRVGIFHRLPRLDDVRLSGAINPPLRTPACRFLSP